MPLLRQELEVRKLQARLTLNHNRIKSQKQGLRQNVEVFCKQPSTIIASALTGCLAGYLYPLGSQTSKTEAIQSTNRSVLLDNALLLTRVLAMKYFTAHLPQEADSLADRPTTYTTIE